MSAEAKAAPDAPFWRVKSLSEMSASEWESLCDGCGRCCLEKLEDADTGAVSYTEVGCRLLDVDSCRCKDYDNRKRQVPDCEKLTARNVPYLKWMPSSCAYRMLSEGKDLADWHPLVSGDPGSVHRARVSIRGRAVAGDKAGDLEDHIVTWPV